MRGAIIGERRRTYAVRWSETNERNEADEPFSSACYLNSGITRSANKRIFFSAISCGMPPK
jgi:hypothetical protein